MIPTPHRLHTGRLVLTPTDPLQTVCVTDVITALKSVRLLGDALPGEADAYVAGPALGDCVGFTGCAVQFDGLNQGGQMGGPWLRIPPASDSPCLLWGRNTRPPRCPSCEAPLRAWREQLPLAAGGPGALVSSDAALALHCSQCGATAAAYRWRWGRHGGAGRSLVFIEEVFPGEAAPLPALFRTLEGVGAGPWHFFYVQD